MKNPYNEIKAHPSQVTFERKWSIGFLVAFLIFLGIIPLMRHLEELQKPEDERWLPVVEFFRHPNQLSFNQLFEKKRGNPRITREVPGLRDHLQAFESGIDHSSLRKKVRQQEQDFLFRVFVKGNRKTIVGNNGVLYYRAGIDALTGFGPLNPEPGSVTRDPDRPLWKPPLPVIESFARQLQERGVELMIVPIPIKPMIEPEGLGVDGVVRHPDHQEFLQQLESLGIEVVDLFPEFADRKSEAPVFLRQDTHWTAATSRWAAAVVAGKIDRKSWFSSLESDLPGIRLEPVQRSSLGDLVGMMGLSGGSAFFDEEEQQINRVVDASTGRALDGNLMSAISVIGDSFINMYEEPGLGFGGDDSGLIGAGFASHLAAELKLQLHTLAINGEGATGVRQAFAGLPDNVVRSRKLVVWAIACRDFLLAESAASRAGVRWREVEFNPEIESIEPPSQAEAAEPLILRGVLREKSAITNPEKTSYEDAIYSILLDGIEVESGTYQADEAYIFLWAFRSRKLLPSANLVPGESYRLKVVPLVEQKEIIRKTQLDDLLRYDLDALWSAEILD